MPSSTRPELIFLAGPQQGQRQVLFKDEAVAGRSATADLPLQEQYVSREQMKFARTPHGWIVENLSDRPLRINGKKYKTGKQIVLATGDLLGVGMQTEVLFVAPGDDAEEALSAFRQAQAAAPPTQQEMAPAPPEPPDEADEAEKPVPVSEPRTAVLKPTDAARKKKFRRYVLFFGIYAVGLGALVLFLANRPNETVTLAGVPAELSPDEIDNVLRQPLKEDSSARLQADAMLQQAKLLLKDAHGEGDLYRAHKRFKQALAYAGRTTFELPADITTQSAVTVRLVRRVQAQYHAACLLEQERNWQAARDAFEKVLEMVPEESEHHRDEVVYNKLVRNVLDHRAYVNERQKAALRSGR